LSAVHLSALGGRVLVKEDRGTWQPDTGQLEMAFGSSSVPGPVVPCAVESDGPSADDHFDAGLELEGTDGPRAMAAYRRALAMDGRHADAHLNLGRLHHEAGDLARADEHYRAALRSDPTSARAAYNLGVALEDQGRPREAAEAYEEALRLEGDLAVAHFNLSRLREAEGRPAEALQHLASYKRILARGGLSS
jgi:tetratricopeptide (TPR) repeat protein